MTFNEKKSGLIILDNKKFKNINSIKNIPIITDYKYLGYEINRNSNLNTFLKRIWKKIFTIIPKIKFVTDKLSLHKKWLILKTLIISNFDYIGPVIMLAKQKEVDKVKATIRKAIRIIFKLGPNVKNEIVEKIVSPNRELIWGRRLLMIKSNWSKYGVELNSIDNNIINNKMSYYNNENEFNLKNINDNIIDILNMFNRASCNKHENKFLNTKHLLEEHKIYIDYDYIIDLIYNEENNKIKELF